MLREDADYLEDEARAVLPTLGDGPWSATALLDACPERCAPGSGGCWRSKPGPEPGQLTAAHVESLDALLTSWHGQGPLNLPGHVRASRSGDLVTVAAVSPVG